MRLLAGPYAGRISSLEEDIKSIAKKVHDTACIHEQQTGLAPPSRWDLVSDRQALQEEPALQVGGGGRRQDQAAVAGCGS